MPQFTTDNSYVSVPSDFIENYLPDANPTFVKVYLYIFMLASRGIGGEYAEIAKKLNILESDLIHSLSYWRDKGLLTFDNNGVIFGTAKNDAENAAEMADSSAPETETGENVAEIISSDKALSDMFTLAQEIFGKAITEKDMQTIYWFYQDLKMPVEVILMLIEYCVSKGKNRMSYIEKVAISWNEMGLNNIEAVTNYLKSEEQKTGFLYSIRRLMGIADRNLSQIEEQYLIKWHDDYSMSEEMIALAYEYCIIQTAKLSFPYMDKIITRWHDEKITTVAQAESDNKKFRKRVKSGGTAFGSGSYDSDSLERLSRSRKDDQQ